MPRKSERSKNKPIKYSPSQSIPFPEPSTSSNSNIMSTPTIPKTAPAMFSPTSLAVESKPCASFNADNLSHLLDGFPEMPETVKQFFLSLVPALFEKFDSIANRIVNELKEENTKLKVEVDTLKKRLNDQHGKIVDLQNQSRFMKIEYESDVNRLDQYSRRSNIELAGIPDNVEEDVLEEKVIDILKEIDIKVAPNEIEACHRLFQPRGVKGPRRTIVRFVNRKKCELIMSNKKKMKNINKKKLGLTDNIYVNYSLCRDYRRIWNYARKLYGDGVIARFWVSNGTVKIALAPDSSPISIFHKSKLEELFPGRDLDGPIVKR